MRDKLHPSWVNRPKEGFTIPSIAGCGRSFGRRWRGMLDSLPAFPFQPGSVRHTWKGFLEGDRSVNSSQILTLATLARWLQRHDIQM